MRRFLFPLFVLLFGAAVAQSTLTTVDGGSLGYRLGYPSGWVVEREDDASYLNIQPPPSSPEAGRVAIEFLADPEVDSTLDEGIEEVLAELRANLLPDLMVQSRTPATVSGVPAVVIRLTGAVEGSFPVTYRLVIALQGRTGYVLFLEATSEDFASYEPLFDQVQASFVLTQTQVAPSPPLAPVSPLGPLAPVSPLGPLAPVSPPLGAPNYAGTFVGEQLRLALDAPSLPGGMYAGTLDHGDQRYPVSAQLTPQGLAGEFESGGNRFPFTASLAGDGLTFSTGGANYALVREAAAPPAPVNPLAPPPGSGSVVPAPMAPEVVATETGSAFIGNLPPNGTARGRLDGIADTFTFHTYVVDVPAGATRLTIVLDAEIDLDIAVKQGSEILSYAEKDRGGDWDLRDIGTQNPTTIVVERPAAGLWYVDVINALGAAARNGSYRLAVTTTGGGQ